jgi:response regulator RpfG family c-di-GMP phosphodiesterase
MKNNSLDNYNKKIDEFENQIKIINKNDEKVTFLIVDDNSIINDSMKRLLNMVLDKENIEYEIIMLNDGFDILRILLTNMKIKENNLYIFTDENMDFLSGSDAISLVRVWEKMEKISKKINIISITCHEDPKIVNHILSKGADLVLAKPITKTLIKTTLKKYGLIKN